MTSVHRLNHAVLYVSDIERSVSFYRDVLGMEEVIREAGGRAVFLRAPGSGNHHDLGLFALGAGATPPPRGSVGLYHLAWQVDSLRELASMRSLLAAAGALGGQADHGATKSLYAKDPDGIEFEVMWPVPRSEWGDYENEAPVLPLDLDAELARFGAD